MNSSLVLASGARSTPTSAPMGSKQSRSPAASVTPDSSFWRVRPRMVSGIVWRQPHPPSTATPALLALRQTPRRVSKPSFASLAKWWSS